MSNCCVKFSVEYLISKANCNGFPKTLHFVAYSEKCQIIDIPGQTLSLGSQIWHHNFCTYYMFWLILGLFFPLISNPMWDGSYLLSFLRKFKMAAINPPFWGKCSKNVQKFTITNNQERRFLMSTYQFWGSTSIMKRFWLVFAAKNE